MRSRPITTVLVASSTTALTFFLPCLLSFSGFLMPVAAVFFALGPVLVGGAVTGIVETVVARWITIVCVPAGNLQTFREVRLGPRRTNAAV